MGEPAREPVSINDVYRILSDSTVDKKELLRCMGLPPSKVSEFENNENPERAFKDSLEYFLNYCTEKGKEWDEIIDCLEQNGDTVTIEKINQFISQVADHSDEYTYCGFQSLPSNTPTHNPAFPYGDETLAEHYDKLKTETTTRYNKSKRRIDECHHDIHEALDTEHRNAKTLLDTYKEHMKSNSDRMSLANKELLEKANDQRKKIEIAITKLKSGDHSGIAILKACESDIIDLKTQKRKIDDGLESYKNDTHKPYSRVSASDFVEDLKRVMTISSEASGNIDDDYVTINSLI